MGKRNPQVLVYCFLLFCFSGFSETLRFDQVVKKVMDNNPELTIKEDALKAAEAEQEQAKVIPNPELEIELENMGRNEMVAVITQPIELGGKRKSRMNLAEMGVSTSHLEKEAARLKLKAEVMRNVIPTLAVKMKIEVIDSLSLLIQETIVDLKRRIDAGATKAVDLLRAEMEWDQLQLGKKAIERELEQLTRKIALLWGDTIVTGIEIEGAIETALPQPEQEEIADAIKNHPEIKLIKIQQKIAESAIEAQKAEAVPEAAISGGYLRNNAEKENAAILGFSMGLPIFNRNKGSVKAATHEYNAIMKEYNAAIIERISAVQSLQTDINGVDTELTLVNENLIPKAMNIHNSLQQYYGRGSISILEVLESRRQLLELRLSSVELVMQKALLYADLLEITGIPFKTVN